MAKPRQVKIRAYQVGFGDCFLLTFVYEGDNDRHVLIDFGSTAPPAWSSRVEKFSMSGHMADVARDIAEACAGKLHAVVATHRHKDHISGFATHKNGKGSGDVIRGLEPDVVIQPWTEDPNAAPDATGPTAVSGDGKAFVAALADMHGVSRALYSEVRRLAPAGADGQPLAAVGDRALGVKAAARLSFMGENNIANRSAVENLIAMAEKGKGYYVHYGSEAEMKEVFEKLLPGVGVRILGPPTLEQTRTIEKQRARDQSDFWHLQARANRFAAAAGSAVGGQRRRRALFPNAATLDPERQPRSSRWLTKKMRTLRGRQLLEIVRILDKAMNNTSVILLFEAGQQKLLFPGDAQIENWNYTLQGPGRAADRELLRKVTFYKVGHHGSLNATPKTLWNGFALRSPDETDAGRLKTMVSTRPGKHGSPQRKTEVPRKTLVEALKKESSYFTTESLRSASSLYEELALDL